MQGCDIKEANYNNRPITEDEIWSVFSHLFSSKAVHDTSYKFGFLKAILDNLYNTSETLGLTFDQLFRTFTEVYWNLVLKHHIAQRNPGKFGIRSSLENILYDAKEQFELVEDIPFESIPETIKEVIVHKVKKKCKLNVVGALYADLDCICYSFSRSGEWLQINPKMYEFLCRHKVVIEKMNYYEWARFLEKVNQNDAVDHLLSKIDESTLHTRGSLAYYRDLLFQEFENKCFYCGKTVSGKMVQVDHFIPWSFIKDDNLWNFVIACNECNNHKSDKLADTYYLDKIITRNSIMVERRVLGNTVQLGRMVKIYDWARQNGYNEIWQPRTR